MPGPISDTAPSLPDRMRTLAQTHPRAAELVTAADRLDAATDAKNLIGAWARARRVWCECTGEPLV